MAPSHPGVISVSESDKQVTVFVDSIFDDMI